MADDRLTAEHYECFGRVVQVFAQYETIIGAVIAGLCGVNNEALLAVTKRLRLSDKIDTLRYLEEGAALSPDTRAAVAALTEAFRDFNALRNHIAHDVWLPGSRPHSVRPAGMKVRQSGYVYGLDDEERDWTLPELRQAVSKMEGRISDARRLLARIQSDFPWEILGGL